VFVELAQTDDAAVIVPLGLARTVTVKMQRLVHPLPSVIAFVKVKMPVAVPAVTVTD
jgi:hypothetical protein